VAESGARRHSRKETEAARRWRGGFVAILLLTSFASSAFAQNYSFDARRIALGGAGGTPNIASKLVERQRRYRSILIPVGLVKLLSDVRVFFPNRDDFDFSRAVEYAYSPLHQVFGRREDMTAKSFFRDLVRAQLEPDLNSYSGFNIDPSVTAEGLVLENWGKTFMLRSNDRSFQGIYVGAGPYIAARAFAEFDSQLVSLLNGTGSTSVPDASLDIGGGETDQLALAITGGYRARFPLFSQEGTAAGRNGMYVAANLHYLQGLRLDAFNAQAQTKLSWPPTASVARAYLDQLTRNKAIDPARATAVKAALDKTEKDKAAKPAIDQLETLAKQIDQDAGSATGRDADRLKALAATLKGRAARLRS